MHKLLFQKSNASYFIVRHLFLSPCWEKLVVKCRSLVIL